MAPKEGYNAYYKINALKMQKQRLINKFKKDNTIIIKQETLDKYNLKLENGLLIDTEEKETPELKDNIVIEKEINDFLTNDYIQKNGKPLSKKTIQSYKQIFNSMRRIGYDINDDTNLVDIFKIPKILFNKLKEYYTNITSLQTAIKKIFVIVTKYEKLKHLLGDEIIQEYNNMFLEITQERNDNIVDKKRQKIVRWDLLIKRINKKYPKTDIKMFFEFYKEVPIRGEIWNLPFVNKNPIETNGIDVSPDKCVVYLNDYKTKDQFGPKEYILTKHLSKKIKTSYKNDTGGLLFPEGFKNKIREAIINVGYERFPFNKDVLGDVVIHSLRRCFSSYMNSELNTSLLTKNKLADKMLHKYKESLYTYVSKDFFNEEEDVKLFGEY